jgi:threonine synthase
MHKYGFSSGTSTHQDRLATMRDAYFNHGQLIDPHTADGVKVARENLTAGIPMIVLETALPAKFAETVKEALQREPDRPGGLEDLESRAQRFEVIDANVMQVRQLIEHACTNSSIDSSVGA